MCPDLRYPSKSRSSSPFRAEGVELAEILLTADSWKSGTMRDRVLVYVRQVVGPYCGGAGEREGSREAERPSEQSRHSPLLEGPPREGRAGRRP